jgi:hypothetical protein
MGLLIDVFRNAHGVDCTADGVSSKVQGFTLVNVEGPFEPSDTRPAAWLVKGNLPGTCKIVVVEPGSDNRWFMMGGNFGYSCDSRFGAAVEKLTGARLGCPVPIHDRHEG